MPANASVELRKTEENSVKNCRTTQLEHHKLPPGVLSELVFKSTRCIFHRLYFDYVYKFQIANGITQRGTGQTGATAPPLLR